MEYIPEIKQEKKIIIALCVLVGYRTITYFINIIFNYLIYGFIWDTLIINLIVILVLLRSLSVISKRISYDMIFLFIFLSILYLWSFLINNNSDIFISVGINLFIKSFPMYILVRSIKDYTLLHKYLKVTSILVTIVAILTYILYIFVKNFDLQYMVFSYDFLPALLYLIYLYSKEKKISILIIIIMSIMVVFLGGARGPLFCILGYILIYFISNYKKKYKQGLLIVASLIFSAGIYINNETAILINTNNILNQLGINSRTIDLLLLNKFSDLSGRDSIYNNAIHSINNSLFGYGLGGDRIILEGYVHNIVLELVLHYGIIFGVIFILTLLVLLLITIFGKDNAIKDLIIIFIPIGVIKLFATGSYLQEPYFFVMLGLIVSYVFYKTNSNIKCDTKKIK